MRTLALALCCALLPGVTLAQQAAGSAGDKPPNLANQAPVPAQTDLDAAPLAAIAGPFRTLYDNGILLSADFYDDLQGNPAGGLQKGYANAGAGAFGLDADLAREGIPGGRLHVIFAAEYGGSLQRDTGQFIKSQDWFLPGQEFQLAQFAYEQSLFGDKVNLYGGRVGAASGFAKPTYGCDFITGSQCPYALPVFTGGFSGFPYATWGGRVRVNPTDKFYVQAGAFSVDPARKNDGGFNFSLSTATGVVVPIEAGYGTDFSNDDYPRHYKIGGWWNDAPSSDPLLNTNGQSRALFGGAPLMNTFDRGGLYALADQVVYRPDDSHRNLALFASLAAPLDQREILSAQNTVGFYDTGPVASRPHDTVGFMVTEVLFTRAETEFLNQLLQEHGSSTFVERDQYDIEANYGYELASGVVVTPNVEYILHPDTTQTPDAKFAPKNAVVIGIRLSFDLDDALGIPSHLPALR
jgi:porin